MWTTARKKLAKQWRRLVRWAFRLAGGYHLSEHSELVWEVEVLAEQEAAELRLSALNLRQRHKMLSRMLNQELNRRAE